MKENLCSNFLFEYENSLFEELSVLESVLKLTKNSCFEQEANSNYYSLVNSEKIKLSEERNHYLNLLAIALEKVQLLKLINKNIENEIYSLK